MMSAKVLLLSLIAGAIVYCRAQNTNAPCSDPGVPRNGAILVRSSRRLTHGSTLNFFCNANYKLFGRSSITCKNGSWSNKIPQCRKISCGRPLSIKNGYFIGTKFTVGQKVRYYCKKGYSLVGRRTRTKCKRNGKWNRKPPKCRVVDYTPCGVSKTNFRARIVGGNKVKRGTWPWQVGVWLGVNKKPHCGGSLIAKGWVLTAAHCLYDMRKKRKLTVPDENFFVKAGDHHIKKREKNIPEQTLGASQIFVHKYFNLVTLFNDIALIKLRRDAKLNKYVRTVCLPKDSKEDLATAGNHGYVAGWGITEVQQLGQANGAQSNVLQHTALPVQDNAICKNSTFYRVNMTHVFCAGDEKGGNDTCGGDAGGPFVRERYEKVSDDYRWIQVGLVSWGEGCGLRNKYVFFTRTAPYTDWIKTTIKDNSGDDKN